MSLQKTITRHLAAQFLAWLAAERVYTIKLFRIASMVEDSLLEQWRSDMYANEKTLDELALTTYRREKIEAWLNILDFGGQYGVDFQSAERKRLFKLWLQTSTTHKN